MILMLYMIQLLQHFKVYNVLRIAFIISLPFCNAFHSVETYLHVWPYRVYFHFKLF